MDSEKSISILVVDDSKDFQGLLVSILECLKPCPTIKTATNGYEALQIFERGGIDLIISDINMPYMNGIELLRSIRHKNISLPILVLSSTPDQFDICLKESATAVCEKVHYKQIEGCLATVIEQLHQCNTATGVFGQ